MPLFTHFFGLSAKYSAFSKQQSKKVGKVGATYTPVNDHNNLGQFQNETNKNNKIFPLTCRNKTDLILNELSGHDVICTNVIAS